MTDDQKFIVDKVYETYSLEDPSDPRFIKTFVEGTYKGERFATAFDGEFLDRVVGFDKKARREFCVEATRSNLAGAAPSPTPPHGKDER